MWCACARADEAGFVYLYALHDSRSADTFYSIQATKPVGPPQRTRPYFEVLLQRDSRSVRGVFPQTLNDNFGLVAGGIQYQGGEGLRLFAQVGSTFNFGPPTLARTSLNHFDARGGVQLYRSWDDLSGSPRRSFGSLYGDAIYYSRYQNAIAYVEAEQGHEFGHSSRPLQLFGRFSASADSRRFYYNNVVSVTAGLRLLPLGRRGPALGVEEAYSSFIGPSATLAAAGVERAYFSFRPVITFGASF